MDTSAVLGLYRVHAAALLLYVQSIVRDAAGAEDIVHEAFVRAIEGREGMVGETAPGLLFTIARNLAFDELRRERRRRDCPPRLVGRERADDVDAEALSAAIDALPSEQREVVVLKAYAEMTFADIARVTGVATQTAASRYRYALEKLSTTLRMA